MQGVKLSTSCNATEGHTTSSSTKRQGTEIEYMHKAVNRLTPRTHICIKDVFTVTKEFFQTL